MKKLRFTELVFGLANTVFFNEFIKRDINMFDYIVSITLNITGKILQSVSTYFLKRKKVLLLYCLCS